jgi:DNA-binding beta-propeller fold protein YncE
MHRRPTIILISTLLFCAVDTSSAIAQVAPTYQTKWGTRGTGDGEFLGPHGVAVAPSGHVYVSEFHGHRIQKFTIDGLLVAKWGEFGGGRRTVQ